MSAAQGTAARSGAARTAVRATSGRTIGRSVVAAVAAGVVLAIGGCTSDASSTSAFSQSADEQALARTEAAAAPSASPEFDGGSVASPSATEAAGSGAAAQQVAPALDTSKVIRTADLSVRMQVAPVPATDDATADREANAAARAAAVNQAASAARGIATGVGGYQSSADGGGSTVTISLRVPADQYDAVVERLAALGEVTSRTESSQDVTAELVDVDSRVQSMTASVARVRALLAQATTVAEVISVESELAVREANLESLQQQQAYLGGQVSLSTVTMTLTAITDDLATEPVTEQTGFLAGIKDGWAALVGIAGWLGGAVGAILPFLPLVAAAGLLLWWLLRLARRRRAARTPNTPTLTPPAPAEPAPQPAGLGTS